MGTFVRRSIYVLGALTALLAGAVAVYVGPGDLVRLPGTTVPGGAPVTVVPWDLLGYTGTTLHVQAAAAPGAVFVGSAHPVDLASWLGGARVTRVQAVDRGGALTVEQVGDAAKPVPKDAGTATFWADKVSGPGEQTLRVRLTGEPVSVAVVSAAGSSLTMSLGATVPGLFRLVVAVAGCGLLLVIGALVWTFVRRRRRRRRASSAPEGSVEGAPPGETTAVDVTRASRARQAAVLSVAVLGVAATSGCLAIPQAARAVTVPMTKPALSGDPATAAKALLADYDKRNNAVIAAIAKGGKVDLWAQVDGGSVLAGDRYSTVLGRELHKASSGDGSVRSAVQAYVPSFTAYPMTVVVEATVRSVKEPLNKEEPSFEVYRRDSVTVPWKLVATAYRDASAPKPAPAGRVVALTAAQKKQIQSMVGRLTAYVGKGTAPGFTPSASLEAVRQSYVDKPQPNIIVTTDCFPKVELNDALGSTTVVPTSSGRLLVVSLACDVTYGTSDGSTLYWQAAYAKALNTTAATRIVLDHLQDVTVVLAVDDSGRVTSLGANAGRIPYS